MRDIRLALRSFRHHPGFAITATLTLAIAIAANSLIFSVVRTTLLNSLPFRDPDRLVALWEHHPLLGKQEIAPADFRDWREQSRSFERMAAYTSSSYFEPILSGAGAQPEKIGATLASSDLLPVLGVHPSLGRNFLDSEDAGGHNAVAMLSDRLWRRRYGADPGIIGKAVNLDGAAYTVTGILPPRIRVPDWADVWIPLSRLDHDPAYSQRQYHALIGIARLKQGVTLKQASADLGAIVERQRRDFPLTNGPTTFEMRPLQRELTGAIRSPLIALSAAVCLILLIASANVANLLLMRAAAREQEIATRRALGASAGQLIRHFLIESCLLSLSGAVTGLVLAQIGVPFVRGLAAHLLADPEQIALDWNTGAFALALAVITTSISVFATALHLLRSQESLQLNARNRTMAVSQRKWQATFMGAQIAIAVAVLISAGLLVRTFRFLLESDPGFQTERVISCSISLSPTAYDTSARTKSYYEQLLSRLASLPGVTGVATVNTPPLTAPTVSGSRFFVDVLPDPGPGHFPVGQIRVVSPDYFRTMGISLQQGRYLEASDEDTRNVVINSTLARRFFRSTSPIGRNIVSGLFAPRRFNRPIVGVVADTKDTGLQSAPWPTFYLLGYSTESTVLVRSNSAMESLIPAIRREALAVDPAQLVGNPAPIKDVLASSLGHQRFSMNLFSLLSAIALILAAIGTYGVIANQTERRIPELGIRIALGAGRGDVYRTVIQAGSVPTAAGIIAGLLIAVAFTRLLRGMLFGVALIDSPTYIMTAGLMMIVVFAAMAIPARRATRIDPALALRSGQ